MIDNIPSIECILKIDSTTSKVTEYKNFRFSGSGDSQRIFVDFLDSKSILLSSVEDLESWEPYKDSIYNTYVRVVIWRNPNADNCKIQRYQIIACGEIQENKTRGHFKGRAINLLNEEKFFNFLKNYQDLMEWYMFNQFCTLMKKENHDRK